MKRRARPGTAIAAATALTLAALLACAACGSKGPAIPSNVGAASWVTPLAPMPSPVIIPAKDPSPTGLEGRVLVNVPEGGIGPFLARRGDVIMAAYVGATEEGRRVVSVPLSITGEARSDAKIVAPIAADATTLVLRATGGSKPGFVAAWTSLTDRGEALAVVGMRDDGRPLGEPTELARTTDDIAWVGVVPTRAGALVAWAEQPKEGGDASVLAAVLGSDGTMRGVPSRVARGVRGWQLVATGDGAALALVMSAAGDAKRGVVTWLRLDASARPAGAPVTIASSRVAGNVDAAWVGAGSALVAWTDLSQADPAPMIARIDESGHVDGPRRATDAGAGGTLVAVAPGVIAWEEPFRRGRPGHRVMLAPVRSSGAKLDVGAPIALELEGRGDPELVKLGDGVALLAPARVCALAAASCDDAPVLPTFVRFDAELHAAQVEPFRIGVLREGAGAGWSLSCDPESNLGKSSCLALALGVSSETSTPQVLAVEIPRRDSLFRAPFPAPPPPGSPLVEAIDTAITSGALADLSATRVGDGAMVATLGAGNEEAKRDDMSVVSVRAYPAAGPPAGALIVTKRALPAGGVAIAGTGDADDGAAVAWVARDAGDPQVHVTRLDKTGKIVRDLQLTNARGDASDVAIAWAGEQWIVAWVDARDGNGEVYAATLDRDGRVVGKGQRITNAPGDASDVALLARQGKEPGVLVAWADPRESPQDGFADVYVAMLRAKDASRAGDETRVLATAAHSRSPVLAAHGGDVALAWIEEAPMGADASRTRSYGAMLAWLDANGHAKSDPARIAVAGDGFPTAIALDDSGRALHAVLARGTGEAMVLDATDIAPGSAARPFPLLTLDGPPSLDVALGLVGRALFFNDEGPTAESKRARRAMLRW